MPGPGLPIALLLAVPVIKRVFEAWGAKPHVDFGDRNSAVLPIGYLGSRKHSLYAELARSLGQEAPGVYEIEAMELDQPTARIRISLVRRQP